MEVRIRSLGEKISKYKELLERKLDYDRHYNIYYSAYQENYWTKEQVLVQHDELKDVEVNSIKELFDIFSEFEEGMGTGRGHITVDVKDNIVYILDTWIE